MEGMNFKQWGLQLIEEDEHRKVYLDKNTNFKYTFFKLYPGMEMMFCSFGSKLEWEGRAYQVTDYFQFSYSHHGIVQMELKKDRYFFCDPGDIYVIQNAKKSYHGKVLTNNYRGFNLLITPEYIPDSIKETFENQFGLNLKQLSAKLRSMEIFFKLPSSEEAIHICEELFESLVYEKMGMIRLKTVELLMWIMEADLNQLYLYKFFSKCNIEKTRAIKEYMEEHLAEHMTIEQLCHQFEITPTVFKSCFKELYHHPPYEYLLKMRMVKAAELLELSDKNIMTIALDTGYENSSNFTRAFKNIYRVTPSQYRKNKFTKIEYGTGT
ncbi:AraC family transcriptional regulator [Bacillus sp. J14TS2]|uniref:helix-turn-helix transcriptional regulator n=1 Tax=Bacillus sp. J14TS2 TaxID=2807188 RepID=UPI001B19EF41|nr:AraC family transcriptional regulator [Bacillus sp. J14TS2]GIN74542.1 AraC family transcriptional regulator [Bacillus sp. J14TS2]